MKRSTAGGFTLIEILVAATIVAVLSVIGVVSYNSVNKRSRDAKRKSDLEQVRSALEMYRSDNGVYPGVGSGFAPLTDLDSGNGPLTPTYLPSIPMDPKSTASTPIPYYYDPIGTFPNFYSYCICACIEEQVCDGDHIVSNTCGSGVDLPSQACNYGLKNP